MSVDDLWTDQRDDVFDVVADIDPPSARIEYAYKAGYQAAEAAITHLRAQVQQWEDFDFERDNPKRLVEHILSLMVERDAARREIGRQKEALRLVYSYAAAIQRMSVFAPIGFRCSLIREAVSRALPDDEAKRLHDETEIILDTLTEERPGESQT